MKERIRRIRELENSLERRIRWVAFDSFYREYESRQVGARLVLGKHVQVYVPATAYKPVMREQLRAVFQDLYGDIVAVRLEPKIGIDGVLYRPVTLILSRVI